MLLSRDCRKNMYKYFNNGESTFSEWNSWFKALSEDLQQRMYDEYSETKECDDEVEVENDEMTKLGAAMTPAMKMAWAINSLGCVSATPVPTCAVKQEKGTTMDTRTEAQQAKDYLITSLRGERQKKIDSEFQAFNLGNNMPKTVAELKDGLAKGYLTIFKPERYDDEDKVYCWQDYVMWVNPDKKPDEKGFEAARKQIELDVSDVQDKIVVFGAEKGLEALTAFKAKSYH